MSETIANATDDGNALCHRLAAFRRHLIGMFARNEDSTPQEDECVEWYIATLLTLANGIYSTPPTSSEEERADLRECPEELVRRLEAQEPDLLSAFHQLAGEILFLVNDVRRKRYLANLADARL